MTGAKSDGIQIPTVQDRARGATSTEVYGFVGWTSTAVAYVLFILWAYIPESTLHDFGVTYYPSKYWAIALPAWVCVAVVTAYFAYESANLISVPAMESASSYTDSRSRRAEEMAPQHPKSHIPPLADLPIDVVSALIYLQTD